MGKRDQLGRRVWETSIRPAAPIWHWARLPFCLLAFNLGRRKHLLAKQEEEGECDHLPGAVT